ncbi:ScyD/ScyE family protein [Streptomyces sp. N2-109]|uniref:ScyD/ScyE family protein n=1 Tax=Streptomyces gossypii TaxID=2883101 RepID=A0ABT2JM20_9ACTN|nr:ScyD/ScyE family protein [Streptomyces gossypii]MCT2588415.1 ScyD/ScyE family protein [Streptomyces gossypii]
MYQAKRRLRFTTLATAVAGVLALGLTLPSTANGQESTEDSTKTSTVEVVYEGLNAPRKVTWDSRFNGLLVAESGRTSAPCIGDSADGCFSKSGAILAYRPQEDRGMRVVTGLPALFSSRGMAGISEVNPHGSTEVRAVFGLGGRAATRDAHGPDAAPLGQVNRITVTGRVTPVADLTGYEEQHNPDGDIVDSNPFGMISDSSGSAVVDAAANDVLHVGRDGSTKLLQVLPTLEYEGKQLASVPSAIDRGPDGAYYVGEMGGSPSVGKARVWRLVPGGEPELVSGGFTNVLDLAFDKQGRPLVLELAEKGLASGDQTGRLVRIEADGGHTVLARDELAHPGGVTVAPNGDIYVTNRITSPDGQGQLLRIRAAG